MIYLKFTDPYGGTPIYINASSIVSFEDVRDKDGRFRYMQLTLESTCDYCVKESVADLLSMWQSAEFAAVYNNYLSLDACGPLVYPVVKCVAEKAPE